tara:strand:+ start:520 stop:954 length:435 start_codon:yes stop_codon:yes gene_type:complete
MGPFTTIFLFSVAFQISSQDLNGLCQKGMETCKNIDFLKFQKLNQETSNPYLCQLTLPLDLAMACDLKGRKGESFESQDKPQSWNSNSYYKDEKGLSLLHNVPGLIGVLDSNKTNFTNKTPQLISIRLFKRDALKTVMLENVNN